MPRFAANLSMMYGEHDFLDRFAAAAHDGFAGVEFLFPYEHPAPVLAQRLRDAGLEQVLFNLPPGRFDVGERGLAALHGRRAEFRGAVEKGLDYAVTLGCTRLHAMAGLVPADDADTRAAMHDTYVSNLAWAAERCAPHGITLLIEPLNPRDMPGYFLRTQEQAHAVVAEVGAPNLKVQMDLYHCQITEGDLSTRLRTHFSGVGHVQIAGVPGRNEPDTGEIAHDALFALLDELGYAGWVGCEYRPRAGTTEGLGWLKRWQEKTR